MNDILIITGTCGVGKTTLCLSWAKRRQGACIECDEFRGWIKQKELRRADRYQESLLARQACSLAKEYLQLHLDVALDNVWTPKGLKIIKARLSGKARIRVFWLNCSKEENRKRDKGRSPSKVMGGRVDELQAELEAMRWPGYVIKLDTTGQSPARTLEAIEKRF